LEFYYFYYNPLPNSLGSPHFIEMSHIDCHVSLHILVADVVCAAWIAMLVCKRGMCHGDYHVVIYILVTNMVSVT